MKTNSKAIQRLLLSAVFCSVIGSDTFAQETRANPQMYDWSQYPVPVQLAPDMEWQLQPESDQFDYDSSYGHLNPEFTKRWIDYYHANWDGPGVTIWRRDMVSVSDGNLRIAAKRDTDEKQELTKPDGTKESYPVVYTGCISSKTTVQYPVYVEACAKLSKSTLASDVWMLSPDDTQEIDIIEAYGGDRDSKNDTDSYWAKCIHLSHHVFIREPFQDYQPTDQGSWYQNQGTLWRDQFHRVGVYWKNPTHLEYYVDGQLVRTVSGIQQIDPKGFTKGPGLDKALNIIINQEDQTWRTVKGLSPSEKELENEENMTFLVDWIRVEKPIRK